MINHFINVYTSTLVSSLTGWKGTTGSRKTEQPEKEIVLFDREGCPDCRSVRQVITELNLDVKILPCPEGGTRFKHTLKEVSGSVQIPCLVDENTGQKLISKEIIIEYLFNEYGKKAVPQKYSGTRFDGVINWTSQLLRGGRGEKARSSLMPEKPLTLYSFESSPFSRPVRELLCELEIPYTMVSLGKQQSADMGPAAFRFHRGPYKPVKDSKRERFLAEHGDVMVPYLEDPNTGEKLFQSKKILNYLQRTYGQAGNK
ncbi:glutathione S-transferase N-terminal domain-containing protein [Litoribacillus peritrichatus]|uniref:Glutathione S-transferase N-terminal domain-containing protein n=1 Tax=Litoribacillus peritrichatus TaxID=718191 RepID=A0ABP7MGS9_9GAMM